MFLKVCPERVFHSILMFIFLLFIFSATAISADFAKPEKIVVIKSDDSVSCGFFAKQDGKTYIFTSIFALSRGGLTFSSYDGKQVKPLTFEMASDRDLVRISFDGQITSFFEIDPDNVMGETATIPSIVVKDNEQKDKPDIQTFSGKVVGVGPEFFRISDLNSDFDIVGAPVLCKDGKLIGVMSYEIPVLSTSKVEKKEDAPKKKGAKPPPKKYLSQYSMQWENNTCSRLNGDIKWITLKVQDIVAQAKLIVDTRNFMDGYMDVLQNWYANPFAVIDLTASPPPLELKGWATEHNRKMANSSKYIANIEKDANHYQEVARQLQESAKADGMRLSSFSSTRATAIRNADGSPYIKLYYSETAKVLDGISQILAARSSNLLYIYPHVILKSDY